MENASDALKMAGAMLLFVGALSIAILVLSKARLASASIMEKKDAQKSYYYLENVESEKVVGIDTVIASMYNYYQTQSTLLFYKRDSGSSVDKPVTLYYSEASDAINPSKGLTVSVLDKAALSIWNMENKGATDTERHAGVDENKKRAIFGIDIHDELTRQEPWTRNEQTAKEFIDAMVNRVSTPGYDVSLYTGISNDGNPHDGRGVGNEFRTYGEPYVDTTTGRTIYNYKLFVNFAYGLNDTKALINMNNAKFIERVGIYNYEAFYNSEYVEDEIMGNHLVTNYVGSEIDKSRTYFEETEESIENKNGEKKTVIEYIYIGS